MMDEPAWLSALKAMLSAAGSSPDSRFAQLATIGGEGRPSNRTLVFRRLMKDHRLVFTTDARSEKTRELAANPWAELCWWFPATREQFRIQGRAFLLDGTGSEELARVRSEIWIELKEAAKRSFTWPVPGQPLADQSEFQAAVPEAIPSHFSLLLLAPERVDHLDLKTDPHSREIHTCDGVNSHWKSKQVNP